jgi:hypothetical protein
MSILDNLFDQYLWILKDILRQLYDEKRTQDISIFMEREYKSLITSEATKNISPKDINQKMHLVTPCFMIALYRALKNESSLLVSLDLIKKLIMRVFREFVGPLADMQKNGLRNREDKWKKFKEQTVFGTENTYNSFEPEFVKNNDTILEFHLKRCVYYDVFKAHGELDLAPILCYYDDILAEAIQEWITFERLKTIADGDAYCQFIYFPKDSRN